MPSILNIDRTGSVAHLGAPIATNGGHSSAGDGEGGRDPYVRAWQDHTTGGRVNTWKPRSTRRARR
jgi:hypothetical protein